MQFDTLPPSLYTLGAILPDPSLYHLILTSVCQLKLKDKGEGAVNGLCYNQKRSNLLTLIKWQGRIQRGGSGGSSTPLRSDTTANLVAIWQIFVTDKQQLVAKTNNKLTGLALNGSFSSLLGLKQPSLSSNGLQERVNEGHGQHFRDVAKNLRLHFARVWLSTSLPQILNTPLNGALIGKTLVDLQRGDIPVSMDQFVLTATARPDRNPDL